MANTSHCWPVPRTPLQSLSPSCSRQPREASAEGGSVAERLHRIERVPSQEVKPAAVRNYMVSNLGGPRHALPRSVGHRADDGRAGVEVVIRTRKIQERAHLLDLCPGIRDEVFVSQRADGEALAHALRNIAQLEEVIDYLDRRRRVSLNPPH